MTESSTAQKRVGWGPPCIDEARMRRLIECMRRIPQIRLAYRQIKNGHRTSVAIKPAHKGRRHGW